MSAANKPTWRAEANYRKYGCSGRVGCRFCAHHKDRKDGRRMLCTMNNNAHVSFFGVCDKFKAAA